MDDIQVQRWHRESAKQSADEKVRQAVELLADAQEIYTANEYVVAAVGARVAKQEAKLVIGEREQ